MLDIRIREKEQEIERRNRLLENAENEKTQLAIPMNTRVIEGALEVPASPEGLIVSPDQSEGYDLWLDSFEAGKVVSILGKRGSGKTSICGKIG